MIQYAENSIKNMAELSEALCWLERDHPDRVAVIQLIQGHLKTMSMAASTKSFTVSGNVLDAYYRGNKEWEPINRPNRVRPIDQGSNSGQDSDR